MYKLVGAIFTFGWRSRAFKKNYESKKKFFWKNEKISRQENLISPQIDALGQKRSKHDQPWWILSKNIFSDELGHLNRDFSCPRSWTVLRGLIEKMTRAASKPCRNDVFEPYPTLFDAGHTMMPNGEEIQTTNRAIISFTLENIFFFIVFHR